MGKHMIEREINLDEKRRIYAIGLDFVVNEYDAIDTFLQHKRPLTPEIRNFIFARMRNPEVPYCPFNPLEHSRHEGYTSHMVNMALNGAEYKEFVDYCISHNWTLSECARRLIFGAEKL